MIRPYIPNERLLPVRYTPLLWRPLVALIILQTGAGGHKTGGRTGEREQVKKSYRTSPKYTINVKDTGKRFMTVLILKLHIKGGIRPIAEGGGTVDN